MPRRDEFRQEPFSHWQNQLIHHHIWLLGYTAWNGYLTVGRGMVVCQVFDPIAPDVNWSIEPVKFQQEFIAQAQAAAYLQALQLDQAVVTTVLSTLATYDPATALIVLVRGNGAIDISLLQDLALSPADCYQQVRQRWSEFEPDFSPRRGHR